MNPRTPRAPRVVVAAGGTIGHLAPALAVSDELRELGCGVDVICRSVRSEMSVVERRGFPVHGIPVSSLPRRPGIAQLRALAQACFAIVRSTSILRRIRPDAVLAGGGFVSVPVAVAAWFARVPVVVTEADAHLGLSNRISARFARRICVAYPLPQHRRRQTVTGRPVDPAFWSVDRESARTAFGLAPHDRMIAIVGGSGGARRVNEAAFGAWAATADLRIGEHDVHVMHVIGRRDYADFAAREPANGRYRLIEYCDDMPSLLSAADVVVSRAGGSVFELAAVGAAAVLVPYPFATGDHQRLNALYFVQRGAAVLVGDDECTPERLQALGAALLDPDGQERRDQLARNMRQLARPEAAVDIAAIVHELADEHVHGGVR